MRTTGFSLGLAAALAATALAAPLHVTVIEGERNVDIEPTRSRGTYVRELFVLGASRERVLRGLRGPANGPLGFAPDFVSETPVREQYDGETIRADSMRKRGMPEAMGSNVRVRFVPDGLEAELSGGMVTGTFRIIVGPQEVGADGSPSVKVTEVGAFTILKTPPRSLFGLPQYMFANWTPVGWMMQALGGAAVSAGHIAFFTLEKTLEVRLNSGLPAYTEF